MTEYGNPGPMPSLDELDPDTAGTLDDTTHADSMLDELRDILAQDVQFPTFTYHLAHRDGWSTVHRLDFTIDDVQKWARAATPKGREIIAAKNAGLALAQTCIAILKGDQRVVDEKGDPLTIAHPDMLAMTGKPDAWQAARAFYGHDADLIRAANSLASAAGYDDMTRPQDPTE